MHGCVLSARCSARFPRLVRFWSGVSIGRRNCGARSQGSLLGKTTGPRMWSPSVVGRNMCGGCGAFRSVSACRGTSIACARKTRRRLGQDHLAGCRRRSRSRRLRQQRRGAKLHPDNRHQGSNRGFSTHINFGGAEAPEQLLPYLERRHGISDQADSVYRSVNAPDDRVGSK